MAVFTSNLRAVIKLHQQFADNAIRAACIVVQQQAKLNVRGGFKSGDWVTGTLMNSIAYELVSGLHPSGRVGTTKDYGAFWELGHHNPFTRKYERKEWLAPALRTTGTTQEEAVKLAIQNTALRSPLHAALGASLLRGMA